MLQQGKSHAERKETDCFVRHNNSIRVCKEKSTSVLNELAAHGKTATVSASFQMTSSTTSFNSISEQTGPCKATPLAPDSFGGKGWEQTTQPSASTRMFQKTSAHVTTGHRPPNLQKWKNYPGIANPDWSSAQGKSALFGGCWWAKDDDCRKWARDEDSPGPRIHSRKGRDGDTQTHQNGMEQNGDPSALWWCPVAWSNFSNSNFRHCELSYRLGKHITWKQPASDALTSARIPSIHNANIFYPIVELNLRKQMWLIRSFLFLATLALWRFGKMECSHLWHQPKIGALILLLSQQLGTNWRETTSCTSCSGMGVNAWRAEIMNQRTLYKVARKLAIKALKSWLSAVACPIYVASHMPRLTMTIWHPLKQLHLCVVLAQLWGFNVFQISSNLCLNMSSYVTYCPTEANFQKEFSQNPCWKIIQRDSSGYLACYTHVFSSKFHWW